MKASEFKALFPEFEAAADNVVEWTLAQCAKTSGGDAVICAHFAAYCLFEAAGRRAGPVTLAQAKALKSHPEGIMSNEYGQRAWEIMLERAWQYPRTMRKGGGIEQHPGPGRPAGPGQHKDQVP